VRPWDFSISIIDKKGSTYLIQETTEGVFVDGVLVDGTFFWMDGGGGGTWM
jgi:hypothetical protein